MAEAIIKRRTTTTVELGGFKAIITKWGEGQSAVDILNTQPAGPVVRGQTAVFDDLNAERVRALSDLLIEVDAELAA